MSWLYRRLWSLSRLLRTIYQLPTHSYEWHDAACKAHRKGKFLHIRKQRYRGRYQNGLVFEIHGSQSETTLVKLEKPHEQQKNVGACSILPSVVLEVGLGVLCVHFKGLFKYYNAKLSELHVCCLNCPAQEARTTYKKGSRRASVLSVKSHGLFRRNVINCQKTIYSDIPLSETSLASSCKCPAV